MLTYSCSYYSLQANGATTVWYCDEAHRPCHSDLSARGTFVSAKVGAYNNEFGVPGTSSDSDAHFFLRAIVRQRMGLYDDALADFDRLDKTMDEHALKQRVTCYLDYAKKMNGYTNR